MKISRKKQRNNVGSRIKIIFIKYKNARIIDAAMKPALPDFFAQKNY